MAKRKIKSRKRQKKRKRKNVQTAPKNASRGEARTFASPLLSVCMIVKNEEEALPKCLDSVKGLGDELIIVDTGSTDKTVEIAKSYGASVYHFEWIDDFSAARNVSLKHAAGDWILWLDADDILPADQHALVKKLMEPARRGGAQSRHVPARDHAFYFKLENVGGDTSTCYQLRMFPNVDGVMFEMPVHEQVTPSLMRLGITKHLFADVKVVHTGYTSEEVIAQKKQKYLKILESWVEEHPEDYLSRAHIALTYHTSGRADDAIREYEKIIHESPCANESQYLYLNSMVFLGRSYMQNSQYDKAIELFEQVLKSETDYNLAHASLGECYTYIQQPDDAIYHLERAKDTITTSFFPLEVENIRYYMRYFLGKNLERKERLADAIPEYQTAIQIQPNQMDAYVSLARLYHRLKDYDNAHRTLDQAIMAKPDYAENYFTKGCFYLNEKKYDEATRYFQTAIEREPQHSKAYLNLGILHEMKRDFDSAENAYLKATEIDPDYADAHANLGHLYLELGKYEGAKDEFGRAMKFGNVALDIRTGFAYACSKLSLFNEVEEIYLDIAAGLGGSKSEFPSFDASPTTLSSGSSDNGRTVADDFVNLSVILQEKGFRKISEYALFTALELKPDSTNALEELGDLFMSTGRSKQALEAYEKVLVISPDRTDVFFKLGDCYKSLNAHEVAEMCYQKAVEFSGLGNLGRQREEEVI